MRGEFIRADGLIIPNNVSLAGAEAVLLAAFRQQGFSLFAGLVQGAPTVDMTQADMTEPSIGVSGYERVALPTDETTWPVIGTSNSEKFIESLEIEWGPSGAFDQAIQRIALFGTQLYQPAEPVLMLSAPLPDEYVIDTNTLPKNRTFKYRFYL